MLSRPPAFFPKQSTGLFGRKCTLRHLQCTSGGKLLFSTRTPFSAFLSRVNAPSYSFTARNFQCVGSFAVCGQRLGRCPSPRKGCGLSVNPLCRLATPPPRGDHPTTPASFYVRIFMILQSKIADDCPRNENVSVLRQQNPRNAKTNTLRGNLKCFPTT